MSNDRVLQHEKSILEDGYGLISKRLMLDKRITAQAKAVYAFFVVHGNNESFPGMEYMAAALGMNVDTCREHRDYLEAYGYITIRRERAEGYRFSHNIYVIEQFPKERAELVEKINDRLEKRKAKNKKATTKKTPKKSTKKAPKKAPKKEVKKPDEPAQGKELHPYPDFWGTENGGTDNPGINNTSLNNTSLNNTSNKNLSIKEQNFDPVTENILLKNQDRLTEESINEIKTIYNSFSFDLPRFINKLAAAFTAAKNNSKIPAYLKAALMNPDKEIHPAAGSYTKMEIVPEFMKKGSQEANADTELDEETAREIAALQARLKAKYPKKEA